MPNTLLINHLIYVYNDKKEIFVRSGNSKTEWTFPFFEFEENLNLEEKAKLMQKTDSDFQNIRLSTGEAFFYYYDEDEKSIIKIDNNRDAWALGDGVIEISISYKKATKKKSEYIDIKAKIVFK